MRSHQMWIGGRWVDAESGKSYKVVNPATEEEIAQLPLGGKEDVEAARAAFPIWANKSQEERSRIVSQIAAAGELFIGGDGAGAGGAEGEVFYAADQGTAAIGYYRSAGQVVLVDVVKGSAFHLSY